MIGKKLQCPRCKQWCDSLRRRAPRCWNCGRKFMPDDMHRPARSALLKLSRDIKNAVDIRSGVKQPIPGVPIGTPDFHWGFKLHTVEYGKCRPISEDGLKRQAEMIGNMRGYAGLLVDIVQNRMYVPYWFRFLYKPTYDNLHPDGKLQYMKTEDARLYSRLVGRSIRTKAKNSPYKPPVMLSCLDLPVPKRNKLSLKSLRLQRNNDGWHTSGLLCQAPISRINTSYVDHFEANRSVYTEGGISKVDITSINDDLEEVAYELVDCMEKTAKYYRDVDLLDYLQLYPKARSELSSR
jgi:hypothetical protein